MKNIKPKVAVLLICALVSVIALFLNEYYLKSIDLLVYNLIMTISVTLLTTVILTSFSDKFLGTNMDEIAARNFSVLKDCQEYGLFGIFDQFPLELNEIKEDFIKSKHLYIVMNDAKAFISSNTLLLDSRVHTEKNETTFILQDYDIPDIMNALTRKNGHNEDLDYYVNKIKNLISYHMNDLKSKCETTHTFSVYLNPNYNTLAMILTDNFAMVSIYRVAPGKSRVPHFVYQKGKIEYEDVNKDIDKIIKLARKIEI